MRRSICYCEPPIARAGQLSTWKFHYTTANPLAKGAKLKFDIQSQGRGIDWEVPQVNLKEGNNLIYALLEKGEVIAATEIDRPDTIVPQYEFTLPVSVKAGEKILLVIGAPAKLLGKEKEEEERGNSAQLTLQRRRSFLLYVDPKGKGEFEEPEQFSLDVRGSALHTIRALVPSFVTKNKRFDITLRFEDEYGNLTNYASADTLIELSYEHLRENLNWKLFIPETGFVILPNLYFNETGIYRIQLRNVKTSELFFSPPIKCFPENERHLFWGLLHGESDRVDSTESIESCLRHFRDEKAYNFFATSCFENVEETSNEIWKLISQHSQEFNEEERFISYLGFQYLSDQPQEGVRQFVYPKDGKSLLRKKEAKSSTLGKIYKSLSPKEALSIPSFTMGKGSQCNFSDFYPEIERVVEIYNAWGSSECSKKEGNPFPITGGVEEAEEGSVLRALKKNCRFGFVAGGLDDRAIYSNFFESDQKQYNPGLTAIIAKSYTREAIYDALYRRSCYATTGERMIVGFHVANAPMGSELSTQTKPGLHVNRHLSGYVAGTKIVTSIEIIRNGDLLHTIHPNSYHADFYYDDMDVLSKVTLDGGKSTDGVARLPFVFYYIRVKQEDGNVAWSSPIWVDYSTESAPPVQKTKKEK